MNGHWDEKGDPRGLRATLAPVEAESGPADTDLIFDFSGINSLDVRSLSLLLTAQQVADRDGNTVWVAGLPERVWSVFRAMGLDDFFREFPEEGDTQA